MRITSPTGDGRLPRYLAGAALVRTADEGARVAIVLLAVQRTGGAGAGGALVAALLIPHVAAAPAAGLLVDRSRRPMRVVAAAALLAAAGLAVTAATAGRIPLAASMAVLLAAGACGPVMTGALTSRLASVVDAPALPRAFGLDALSYNVAGIAGPALAALMSGVAAPAVATFALAGAAAVGALPLAGLPERRQERRTEAPPPWHAGLRAVARDRVLGVVTVASSLGQLGPGALAVVAAGLAQHAHAASAGGWLMTAVAGGGLLGSLAWTWRPATERRAPIVVMASLAGTGAALAAAAMTRSLPAAAGCFALSGVFAGPFSGALFTTRQAHAPERVRAQVFAIGAGLKTTAAAAGAAAAGALAGLPVATQLLLVASAPLLAACTGAAALATSVKERPSQKSSRFPLQGRELPAVKR